MRRGFWPKCRVCLRWCRIGLLLLILAAACLLLWCNQVGLPSFLKNPILKNLKDRGVLVEFSRMRLRMTRGLVAENVRVGAVANPDSPTLTVSEVQLLLDFGGILHGHWQIQGLVLRDGRLTIPVNGTNPPQNSLEVTNINTDLRFQDPDTWALDNFRADFRGAKLDLTGDVAHASEIGDWNIFHGKKTTEKNDWRAQIQHVSEIVAKIHLAGTPRLTLNVEGDARDIRSFDVHLKVSAPAVETPWFRAQELQFSADLTAAAAMETNEPLSGLWTNAAPYRLNWTTHVNQLRSEKISADSVTARGLWRAPNLEISELSATLGGGGLNASLQFDACSQWLNLKSSAALDLHVLEPLLTATMRERLALITWTEPPTLEATVAVDLSHWLEAAGDQEKRPPPVILNGGLGFANAMVDGVHVDQVQAHFGYSNQVWQVPDLLVVKDRTRLQLAGSEDESTKLFSAHLAGAFDVNMIRPWLKSKTAVREVGRLKFSEPLALEVTIRGQLHNAATLAAEGTLALTNFAARGGPVDSLATGFSYTNRVAVFSHPHALRAQGAQVIQADAVVLDLNEFRLYFTNGFSTTDPQFVADSIGPKTGRTVAPYKFLTPPTATANGYVSLRSSEGSQDLEQADLKVEIVKGAPFQWLRFNTRDIEGTVHWLGGTLDLTNVTTEFYGGRGEGFAHFDFRPRDGTDYSFALDVTNANLHRLIGDLAAPTNRLEGLVGGHFVVTSGNSTNWQLMSGYGNATLRDGLIWDAPMFGVISPALNKIVPGLGSSRATDAAAKFTMTNGVIYSTNMEIHSTAMRLLYVGTVDLKENLDARATAQVLRDTPGLGALISFLTAPLSKLFECKVTGTLGDPKMTPLYDFSKLLLVPLHPLKSLEQILPAGNTNAAPPANVRP